MRKYEPVDLAEEHSLRSRLELPCIRRHAASMGWGVELRPGTCTRSGCAANTDLTYLGLCSACFKAAMDGQVIKTLEGRWHWADITTMRAVVQGPLNDRIEELEKREGERHDHAANA